MNPNKRTIAVLSGKGGTGKTFVSVNLAAAADQSRYYDCDVEEPNGYLFFKPEQIRTQEVFVPIPFADAVLCDGCKECVTFCRFHALAYVGGKLMVFPDVCHSCGGCMIVCPKHAISERPKQVGKLEIGMSQSVEVHSGMMNVGVESGVPVIRALLADSSDYNELSVIDCPPGSACTVTESIRDADFCILVAEPSVFGVHNLDLVARLCRLLAKPFGVILNKCTEEENPSLAYATQYQIPILASIPFDVQLAYWNSEGHIAVRESNTYRELFRSVLNRIEQEADA